MMKYTPANLQLTLKDSTGRIHTVKGFAQDPIQLPKMWHTACQLPNTNWKVSVEHISADGWSRLAHMEFTDENYKKYGFDKLEPTVDNPFKLVYDDVDLVEVTVDQINSRSLGKGLRHSVEGLDCATDRD
ncbi:hypothetical protein [Pseudomonas sp.]|uniref:hypothetical protein n=1 Tax=Pseudomonas sp. TaxID=306 RepID=UPI003FD73B5C